MNTDREIAPLVTQFVPLKVDTGTPQWQAWARKYEHEGRGIPIVYIVRADGEKLYAKSGAPRGNELPQLMASTLKQAGRIYSDAQLRQLERFVDDAQASLKNEDRRSVVLQLKRLKRLGTPGQLGSYSEVALQTDKIVEQLKQHGQEILKRTQQSVQDEQISEENLLEALLEFAQLEREYNGFVAMKADLNRQARDLLRDKRTAPLIKDARSIQRVLGTVNLDRQSSRDRAVNSLKKLAERRPGTVVEAWIVEKLPELQGGA